MLPRGEDRPAEVADRLHSAAIHLLRSARRVDPASGLSPARGSALSVVVYGGPLTLGGLAAAEQVRPPTMTRIVAALEADGLVLREPDPIDRRAVKVRATAEGRRVLEEGRQRRLAFLRERFSGLTPEELDTLAAAGDLLLRLFRPG